MEIAHLKGLYEKYADSDHMGFFFILNRPDLGERAIRLFKRNEMADPNIVKLQKGSTSDFIRGEPTTWIVDAQGIITERHIGYQAGDEQRYERELLQALGLDN